MIYYNDCKNDKYVFFAGALSGFHTKSEPYIFCIETDIFQILYTIASLCA